MEHSVGRMWMIGVSIEMTRQQLGWSRTPGTLEHCHSLLGRWVYGDFEDDAFYIHCHSLTHSLTFLLTCLFL